MVFFFWLVPPRSGGREAPPSPPRFKRFAEEAIRLAVLSFSKSRRPNYLTCCWSKICNIIRAFCTELYFRFGCIGCQSTRFVTVKWQTKKNAKIMEVSCLLHFQIFLPSYRIYTECQKYFSLKKKKNSAILP